MLKILSGEYRSRQLASPPDAETTRPYIARVRESVFNLLRGWFEDASVLDLFAGVGTVGLEAISRGARTVVMVEQDRAVHELLVQNIESLGCRDRAVTLMGDALASTCLLRADAPVDLVFVDPPYAMMRNETSRQRIMDQAERCRSIMKAQSFLVLRAPFGPSEIPMTIPGFDGPEPHKYRYDMWVMLYQPSAASDPADA